MRKALACTRRALMRMRLEEVMMAVMMTIMRRMMMALTVVSVKRVGPLPG